MSTPAETLTPAGDADALGLRKARAEGRVKAIRAHLTDMFDLIAEAWELEDWKTLGYESWEAYIDGEFRDHGMTKLRKTERVAAVAMLREAGMSTRAIAAATGESQSTVSRDVAAGESNGSPVRGTDGKTYPPRSGSAPAQPPPAPAPAAECFTLTLTGPERDLLIEGLSQVDKTTWARRLGQGRQRMLHAVARKVQMAVAGEPA